MSLQPLASISIAISEQKSYNGCTQVLVLSRNVCCIHSLCQKKFNGSQMNPLMAAALASMNLHCITPSDELTKTYKLIKIFFH